MEENVRALADMSLVAALSPLVPASAAAPQQRARHHHLQAQAQQGQQGQAEAKDGIPAGIPSQPADGLTSAALRLLFNLSFDKEHRAHMVGHLTSLGLWPLTVAWAAVWGLRFFLFLAMAGTGV